MKAFLVLAALLAVVGCKHGDSKPQDPVVIVKPPVDPVPPVVGKDAEFCKSAGKKFQCGTNEWWKLDCGGVQSQEQVYFASKADVSAKAAEIKMSGCVQITFKDGSKENVHFGFGPCLPCQEL